MTPDRTFGGIPDALASSKKAAVWLLPILYDGTSTWGKGADRGYEAFLDAAENMELYDIETDSEVYTRGIHLLPEMKAFTSPQQMHMTVLQRVRELLQENKFLTFFGGEHSISIPILEAFIEKHPDLTAHIDFNK